jgi:cell division protease FtsH
MSDAWLPVGFAVTPVGHLAGVLCGGTDWQVFSTREGGRALVAHKSLADKWTDAGIVERSSLVSFWFGEKELAGVTSSAGRELAPVDQCRAPHNLDQALAFAAALRATRERDAQAALNDAIYVEKLSRLLPTSWPGEAVNDAMVLGSWLTGGVRVPAVPVTGLQNHIRLSPTELEQVVNAAGLTTDGAASRSGRRGPGAAHDARFTLPGRPALEAFFNDHVVDVVQNLERYRTLGVGNPGAIVLEGPPGCGKTFAVEKLVAFLGWPSFAIDAASIGSPYIHETSRKVGQLFRDAIQAAPSVVIVDEMEAFLAERESGASGHHRVEEVAEFLRRIPEAIAAGVLVIAMTNRLDMIDAALLRRGRFDHIVKVDHAGEDEVRALLVSMLADLPAADDIDVEGLARPLAGRPISDAAFVVREGARLAARAKLAAIDHASLQAALSAAETRDPKLRQPRIGFV